MLVSVVDRGRQRIRNLTINAAEGHARAGANKSRESLAVGSDDLAALSGVWLLGIKVEDELIILEKREAVDGTGEGVS